MLKDRSLFRLFAILLLLATTKCEDYVCPTNMNCTCNEDYSYHISCAVGQNYGGDEPAFTLNITVGERIEVICNQKLRWSDLPSNLTDYDSYSLFVHSCQLSKDLTLADLAERLNSLGVQNVFVDSFGERSDGLELINLDRFSNMNQLVLSNNGLTSLPWVTLAGLSKMRWINLENNNLTHMPVGIFAKMENLRGLKFCCNKLATVDAGTFALEDPSKPLPLALLDLSNNVLRDLHDDIFAKLSNLELLELGGNNFSSLPANLFKYNTRLEVFRLNNNAREITLPSGLFANLSKLYDITLSKSGLTYLPEDLFHPCEELLDIDLSGNVLVTLPLLIFQGLKRIRRMNLSDNRLETLPEGVFRDLVNLDKLNLGQNRITVITSDMFVGLESLEMLNMNDNGLHTIHERALFHMKTLREVHLENNQLTLEGNANEPWKKLSVFHEGYGVRELYVKRNNITKIFSDWVSWFALEKLDLSYNNVQEIAPSDLLFRSPWVFLDLRHNAIAHVPPLPRDNEWIESKQRNGVIVLLGDNPLSCDCEVHAMLRHLLRIQGPPAGNARPGSTTSDIVAERFALIVEDLRCAEPPSLANVPVALIREDTFTCTLENRTRDEGGCPGPCECQFRPHDQAFLINCSFRGLTEAPASLENTENYAIELDLSGNELTSFPFFFIDNVTVMNLSSNYISDVTEEAIQWLATNSTLEVLELHKNNLNLLSRQVIEILWNFTSLTRLTLHGNPWTCDCNTRELLDFVQRSQVIASELKQGITCADGDRPIIGLTVADLCSLPRGLLISLNLAGALSGLVLGVLAALYCRYQQEIKVWLYAHNCCLWLVTEAELDKRKLYDAFISYSHKDEDFVVRKLVPKLENGPRAYKLCLHYRDWLAGEWIPAQIARSVEESRRTIIVLSPNFLESVWGRLEFRAAHNSALSEGRARVIVLLYGEIGPIDQLDPELKAYLSMNTYVKWGEPWFWDKLRYALPHASDLAIRTSRGVQRSLAYQSTPGTSTTAC